jgi:hypothetical protein
MSLLFLQSDPIASLQPALGGYIIVILLVLLELGEEGRDAADRGCFAILGCVVGRGDPAKRWTRRKEREEVGREFVGHVWAVESRIQHAAVVDGRKSGLVRQSSKRSRDDRF